MKRVVQGLDRGQATLLPECLEDWIDEDSPARVIDAFVDALDLGEIGFLGAEPAATGRPSYHPSTLLKLYIYGYLNLIQSSRRLERETGRNLKELWPLRQLAPNHKTLAEIRKDWLKNIGKTEGGASGKEDEEFMNRAPLRNHGLFWKA